ncbi:MAG: BLUF domain-containing protein [Oleiphilaceae bacterium]|nr:BLUF domain-containing protein [Oleiphilaceae bacterium]
MSLYQLVYVSKATKAFSSAELIDLLEVAKRNNSHVDITGNLIFNGGRFLQVLEGDQDKVKRLFDEIAQDPRHESVKLIYFEPAERRAFSRWSMNMINLDSDSPKNLSKLREITEAAARGEKVDHLPAPVRLLQEFQRL